MLALAQVLAHFDPAKKHGKEYRTRCPAHPDQTPSLDIADGTTGPVFQCRSAGCATRDILAAAGLTWDDVLPARASTPQGFAAIYDYRDAAGILQYQVLRKATAPGTPKEFVQRHPDGSGGWIWKMNGIARIPYRLHELAGHARVFIPEGEKDADRLWASGLPASCNTGGAKKWHASDAAALKTAGVERAVLLQDKDTDGAAHVVIVAQHLRAAGIDVLTLPAFPDVPAKGDVSDWLDRGHTVAELEALVLEQTPTIVDRFPLQFWSDVMQIPSTPTRWVVQGLLPAGGLNFLVAKPKVGKTTLARTLAVAVAHGDDWFGMPTVAGEVWYLMYEGRLADAAAHLRQIGIRPDAPLVIQEQSPTPGHLEAMFETIRQRRPSLVIVDHMQLALQIQKMNDTGIVTLALQPFIEISRETGTTFLFLAHARKGQQGGQQEDAIDALAGAGSFGGACDTYVLLRKGRGGVEGSYRTIETEQRIGEPLTPTILRFDRSTGLLTFAGDVALYRAGALVEELFEALETANQQNDRPTEAAWFAMVPGHRGDKITARTVLMKAGRVTRDGLGVRSHPYVYVVTAPKHAGSEASEPPAAHVDDSELF